MKGRNEKAEIMVMRFCSVMVYRMQAGVLLLFCFFCSFSWLFYLHISTA